MVRSVGVVGGGIAGGAIAARLAKAGHAVTVLEQEQVFTDKVRGEGMVGWGFEQIVNLGLESIVTAVPGFNAATRMIPYDEMASIEVAESRPVDLTTAPTGSPGTVCVGHVELRQALLDHALECGARIQRGADDVRVQPGPHPSVSYTSEGVQRQEAVDLVVVADGKNSPVRRTLGIELFSTPARSVLTGMVVNDGGVWDRSVVTVGVENQWKFFVQPRGDDRVRLYLARDPNQSPQLTGSSRVAAFLKVIGSLRSIPHAAELGSSVPVGPCAGYPGTDAWVSTPLVGGVVLVGDAAGWSDPIIGQGLAVAFRDARVLTDELLSNDDWDVACQAYADERVERMRRLRFANALIALLDRLDYSPEQRVIHRQRMDKLLASDPTLGQSRAILRNGPWSVGPAAFEPSALATIALAH